MSYKILNTEGKVVDAVLRPCFVYYNKHLEIFLACLEKDAQGLSSHDGTTYWETGDFGVPGYTKVTLVEIPREEAEAIIDALDEGKPAPEPEPIPIPDGGIDLVRENTINKMSAACNDVIQAGIDVPMSDGTHHFSLKLEDQLNMISLQGMLASGAESVPYHADGEPCRYFSAADFSLLMVKATEWKIYQESYFNSLRGWIQSMETMEELISVSYGMEIPAEYQTEVLKGLLQKAVG